MLKQSFRLWSLSAKNLFGINEFRYGKDSDKRKHSIQMAIVWSIVAVVFEMYFLISMIGYVMIGMQDIIPIYVFTLTGAMVLMFTLLKAGSVIFQMNTYENLVALPVPKSAIVVSRFMTMYTSNVLFAAAIMVPGMIVYGLTAGKGVLFILQFLIGIVFAPLLPMTAATAVSAVIKGISSRMKHRSLVEAALMIGLTVLLIAKSANLQGVENPSVEAIKDISNSAVEAISKAYPLAGWFDSAVKEGSLLPMGYIALVSAAIFALMIFVLQFFFGKICAALNVFHTKNNYKKVEGENNTLLMSLVKREFRYYFSQSTYLMNTIMGLIMMVVAAVAVTVVGPETIEAQLPVKGAVVKVFPFLLALTAGMMSPTAVSVSLEGKTRWLTLSLPIPTKMQYDSKLLMAFILDAPFYVAAVIAAEIGLKATGFDLLWLIVIPAVYMIFAAVWGQSANLWFPIFNWENEVYVIKQSSSVLVSMLGGVFSALIPLMATVGVQILAAKGMISGAVWGNVLNAVIVAVILVASGMLYRGNCRRKID